MQDACGVCSVPDAAVVVGVTLTASGDAGSDGVVGTLQEVVAIIDAQSKSEIVSVRKQKPSPRVSRMYVTCEMAAHQTVLPVMARVGYSTSRLPKMSDLYMLVHKQHA